MTVAMYWVKFRKDISADEHRDYEEEVAPEKLVELLSNDKVTVFAAKLVGDEYTLPKGLFKNI